MPSAPTGAFEADYFRKVYRTAYDGRNPRYKHQSYVREVLQTAKRGGVLLDIGCAYGAFLREARNEFDCTGCDISEHAVETASGRYPDLKFFTAEISSIPSDRKYDVVTCFDVLEHVPELDEALAKIKSLLTPTGVLVATMPVYDTLVGKGVGLLDKDPTHVHKNSRYWWQERFGQCGYEVQSWKGILRFYFGRGVYLHWCGGAVRSFSPAILIAARPNAD
ncbi:MAG: class I SAM-dependent methyltransferase [Actinomycetota bacterium]